MKKSILLSSAMLFSCGNSGGGGNPNKYDVKKENNITIPISGEYQWEFVIPAKDLGKNSDVKQISIHTFNNDKIEYEMRGMAHSIKYDMIPKIYNESEKRIVAQGQGAKEGKYFVIFLKEFTENTVKIFKKEFSTKKEAEDFPIPENNSEESHGWNIYSKK